MPRGVHSDTVDFYRAYIDHGTWKSYYGPYNTVAAAKGTITRELRYYRGKENTKTGVQALKPVMHDGELMLGWFDIDGQLSFDDAV